MNHRHTFLVFTAFLFLSLPALADERVLTLDPETTEVSFHLGATGHDVAGKLYLQAGEIHVDAETGSAWGELKIDAVRGETGNKRRDTAMNKEVLESSRHPWIVFKAQRIDGTVAANGPSQVSLVGTLTLLGVDHPFTLPADVEVEGDRLEAHTSFVVPYVEWGLKNPSVAFLRVAKEVDVEITAAGSWTAAGSAMDVTGGGQP